ncbi:hypothetical protein [Photorhabdus hindustanensis]|uniref:Uncharacterized protein n=1 Tax=Photorhabdus hindustanensis TaxID=2918802 RepID=A0A2S8Q841_9GAMM|nr:hypothetical protein [Photorhabdus hindustanensis]PQQ29123.1 hypothetical protein C6H66_02250 [Photorhabdus hindustanensis]
MERSLAEDKLIMLSLYNSNMINYSAFNKLYNIIIDKCPKSDGIVFFDYAIQDSLRNHEAAVKLGLIPKFFFVRK